MNVKSRDAWDRYFIELAMHVATKSKDPSTKVGCVIVGAHNNVLSTGFNGFPRGVREMGKGFADSPQDHICSERWARPLKYDFVEHAERNAVFNAARHGIALDGARAFLNWEPFPCKDCAKAFIQSGIKEVVGPDIEFPNHRKQLSGHEVSTKKDQWETGDQWKFSVSQTMMDEAGVVYRRVPWD